MKTDKLFFGAAYYDEYMPYDRIDKDMSMMKAAGMNTIRIAESTWSTWEPADGVFDFTHLHRMLDAAKRHGINVIVGTPTYAIPAWLVKKYPDILAITHNGPGIYGGRQNMDITHEGFLFHAERIIRKLMEEVCHHPNVIGYQIDNETTAYDTCGPNVQKAFVEYLKNKFPDIKEFNHEFGLNYWSNRVDNWDDFPDIRGTINGSLSAEFKKYQRQLVTDYFNWQASIINEYRESRQFLTHNFDYFWTGVSSGMKPAVNQYEAAKCLDVIGTDIYHHTASELTGYEIAFGGSLMRSLLNSNYLVLETQAQGNMGWLPYPGQLRLQGYSHISSGANSVMYWHWHSIHNSLESYWKGVLSHNLKENATYREAKIMGEEFNRIGSSINNLTKKCDVAIMVDNESLDGLDEFPVNPNNKDFKYNSILRWVCEALYFNNIEFDIIPQNATPDRINSYKMLVVPAMYSATEESLLNLKNYVNEGGHLVMTFKSAFANKQLKIYFDDQPHLLTDCFGMTYDQFTCNNVMLSDTSFDGDGTKVSTFMELVIPQGATTLARYNHPAYKDYAAVTTNSYGKGVASYIGCYMDSQGLSKLMLQLCEKAGIEILTDKFPLIIKRGINSNDKEVIFYMNYSENNVKTIAYANGINLLNGNSITKGEELVISPWDLIIQEVI